MFHTRTFLIFIPVCYSLKHCVAATVVPGQPACSWLIGGPQPTHLPFASQRLQVNKPDLMLTSRRIVCSACVAAT